MRRSTRSTNKKTAKAKLSGFVSSSDQEVHNQKIVFNDNDDIEDDVHNNEQDAIDTNNNPNQEPSDESEDEVEEVKGNIARESTLRVRNAERIQRDTGVKKRRKKKEVQIDNTEEDKNELGLTLDFFEQLDSERVDKKTTASATRLKKGTHTTFVVDEEYTTEKRVDNIQVISLNHGNNNNNNDYDTEEQNIVHSARMGCTSSNSVLFARGHLTCGDMERGCNDRKRKNGGGGRKDEGWERGGVKVYRSGVGAALLFKRR